MILDIARRVEQRQDPLADELVDGSLVRLDDLGHLLEILAEVFDKLGRRHEFADPRESGNIREIEAQHAAVAAEPRLFAAAQDILHELPGYVPTERAQARLH